MGDRANVVIRHSNSAPVWLYTHWAGTELALTLQRALQRRLRWNDPSYLARIVFCEMVKGHESGETGFGIWTSPPDNEHPVLLVDVSKQTVSLATYGLRVLQTWTLERFVGLDAKILQADYEAVPYAVHEEGRS